MTEPLPTYHTREADLVQAVAGKLRIAGWVVIVTAQDRTARRQLSGLPDVLAFRADTSLLLECKTPAGALRPSQIAFWEQVRPHCGEHVIYRVVRWESDVEEWCDV